MDAYGDIRIDPDGPKQCQSLDDGGECENGGEKLGHGSGGMELLRAA